MSCPPEVVRPAGDETEVEWRGAAGSKVGFVLVHTSPRMSWTRGLSSTPDCATGRGPAPEHVFWTSPPRAPRRRRAKEGAMEVLYPRRAGLDVHKETVVACVRLAVGGREVAREVRTFATTTAGLLELAAWLAEND